MSRWFALCAALLLFTACSDQPAPAPGDATANGTNTDQTGAAAHSGENNEQLVDLTSENATSLADQFCAQQKNLRLLSRSMLGVFSIMSNHPITQSCGGDVQYTKDGDTFQITASDYCDSGAGSDLSINAEINGTVDSGANFFSDVPSFTITGPGVDLSGVGNTYYGRYPDMFFNMTLTDHTTATQLLLDEISIKKGELDLGFITFADLGKFEFRVIKHFNFELTEGQIFFYGDQGEIIIMTAENGSISVVYKTDKLDPGSVLDSSCSL